MGDSRDVMNDGWEKYFKRVCSLSRQFATGDTKKTFKVGRVRTEIGT